MTNCRGKGKKTVAHRRALSLPEASDGRRCSGARHRVRRSTYLVQVSKEGTNFSGAMGAKNSLIETVSVRSI